MTALSVRQQATNMSAMLDCSINNNFNNMNVHIPADIAYQLHTLSGKRIRMQSTSGDPDLRQVIAHARLHVSMQRAILQSPPNAQPPPPPPPRRMSRSTQNLYSSPSQNEQVASQVFRHIESAEDDDSDDDDDDLEYELALQRFRPLPMITLNRAAAAAALVKENEAAEDGDIGTQIPRMPNDILNQNHACSPWRAAPGPVELAPMKESNADQRERSASSPVPMEPMVSSPAAAAMMMTGALPGGGSYPQSCSSSSWNVLPPSRGLGWPLVSVEEVDMY